MQNRVKMGLMLGIIALVTAPLYSIDIQYQIHVANRGWLPWVQHGTATFGTWENLQPAKYKNFQIEAIRIRLVDFVGGTVKYRAHVQDIGWTNWVQDGQTAGTEGQKRAVEAIQVQLENCPGVDLQFSVRTMKEVSTLSDPDSNGIAGTTGQHLPLQAVTFFVRDMGVPPAPMYHAVQPKTHDHFYTVDKAEYDKACQTGYQGQGVAFNIDRCSKGSDSVPLYRLYSNGTKKHFYTANGSENDSAAAQGFSKEGIAGYVYTGSGRGLPLYRALSASLQSHYYTTSNNSWANLDGVTDYKSEGIAGYVH